MENRINVAELLKDCPTGMELDSTIFENVTFVEVRKGRDTLYPIYCITTDEKGNRYGCSFTKYGYVSPRETAKCVIFPKGKTTWEGFHKPFEPGDIVITDHNTHAFIYSGENDSFWECYCGVYCGTRNICINAKQWSDKRHKLRYATKEEKEELFQVIKDNGYEWNVKTKTLEKIEPKFKVSDTIRHKILNVTHTITERKDKYELVPNKFDVSNLKPFDKVLVRDNSSGRWDITFYECYDKTNKSYPYRTLGGTVYKQCIPYKGNEDLAGITKECSDYYKTWINEEDEFN